MVIDGFSAPPIHFLLNDIMSHLHKEVQKNRTKGSIMLQFILR